MTTLLFSSNIQYFFLFVNKVDTKFDKVKLHIENVKSK